jgi:hypothetical protein
MAEQRPLGQLHMFSDLACRDFGGIACSGEVDDRFHGHFTALRSREILASHGNHIDKR